jgi:hypothetical protein
VKASGLCILPEYNVKRRNYSSDFGVRAIDVPGS